jgi:hypothetical protein
VDTLCHGEVAEWLNAAVSKTVTSVIPASGVRIPPSPRRHAGLRRLVSTHRASGLACQQRSLRSLSAKQAAASPFRA